MGNYTIKNFANSTIAGGAGGISTNLQATDTSLYVQAGDGTKYTGVSAAAPGYFMIGTVSGTHEICSYTGVSGDQLTGLTRGLEGTTAQTWAPGASIQDALTAGMVSNLYNMVYNVVAFGAKGDGVTDDSGAIQAAINAAGAAGGGIVFLPPSASFYAIASTLTIGNGSSGANSTVNGVRLRGASQAASQLIWTGAANGTMIAINGQCTDNSIGDVTLHGNNNAGYGLVITSGQFAHFEGHIKIWHTLIACLKITTLSSGPGGTTLNSLGNVFDKLELLPFTGTVSQQSYGLWLDGAGGTTIDTNNNTFHNLHIYAQHNYNTGLRLGYADFNYFGVCIIFKAGGLTNAFGYLLDGTVQSNFPRNNFFELLSVGMAGTTSGTISGTNYAAHYDTVDGPVPIPTSGFSGFADYSASQVIGFGPGSAVNRLSTAINTQIVATGSDVNVLQVAVPTGNTFPQDGLYQFSVYIRQTSASAVTVTAKVLCGSETGSETFFLTGVKNGGTAQTGLNAASLAQGDYACIPIIVRYSSGQAQAPTLFLNVGTGSVVFVSASALQVG